MEYPIVKPFATIPMLNWSSHRFYRQADAQAWADASLYKTYVESYGGIFTVREHNYNKKESDDSSYTYRHCH
jgi:hypothetical protein